MLSNKYIKNKTIKIWGATRGMYVIYHTYINIDVIIIIIYKFPRRFLCCGILQVLRLDTPPTRTKVYIDTHTQPGGKYPNDEVRAKMVWFLHLILKHISVLAYLFRINEHLPSFFFLKKLI
jgi:hypothetical protein